MPIRRAGVAEVGEFSVVSAISSCVLSLSEGISVFSGLGVAGAIPGLFSGKSDNLRVRTARKALCLEGSFGFVLNKQRQKKEYYYCLKYFYLNLFS